MKLTRALWRLIAAFCMLPALTYPQSLVQVPSQRAITGAPPLYQSQPDPQISGRFVSFTASGCALSFSASAVRGLTWSGACSGGRMHGQGTVIGYDYEKQPVFIFEGHIERGLRNNGVMHEPNRRNNSLIGSRTAIVASVLQPPTEVAFLDMPRTFLLALDDWNRQTDGTNLLASMGATWAPTSQTPRALAGPAIAQANTDNGNTTVGRPIQNDIGSNQGQRSAAEPGPMGHVPMGGGPFKGTGTSPFYGGDSEKLAREHREREKAHRENVKRHEEEARRRLAERQLKRDAEAKLQQQRADKTRQEQAAVDAKIRAQVNRSDAISHYVVGGSACPPRAVFTNNTSVNLWVTWDYHVLNANERVPQPGHIETVIGPGRNAEMLIVGTRCHENQKWQVVPGGPIRWHDHYLNHGAVP